MDKAIVNNPNISLAVEFIYTFEKDSKEKFQYPYGVSYLYFDYDPIHRTQYTQ